MAEKAGKHLEQLQQATLKAALEAAETGEVPTLADALAVADREVIKRSGNGGAVGNGGVPTPAGRPKGVRNKLTNLRDAVIEAFDRVGGADYLVKLANGTQSDRAAFVSLMNKVLPTQVQANVEGGIKLELSWLSARNIGTATAQLPEQRTQVLEMEQENDGTYRIIDPKTQAEARESDPLPPLEPGVGGGSEQESPPNFLNPKTD